MPEGVLTTALPDWLVQSGVSADMGEIVSYLHAVRDDLSSFQQEQTSGMALPHANAELDAVVAETESAANRIMDACDTLNEVFQDKAGAGDERARAALSSIYEACSFQDLTSQRIVKVRRTLAAVEQRFASLAVKLGLDLEALAEAGPARTGDAALLNGPALAGAGINQTDIDKLFG